jgi:predicted GNAT family acetyltransferase
MGDAFDAAFETIDHEKKHPYGDAFDMAAQESGVDEEPWWKNVARTALQIPKGIAQAKPYGIVTGLMSMLGTGEALDPEEIDHIKMISEREGIPFDEEKYMQAVQGASEAFPTVENIARGIEHATGLPLEANTWLQKFVNFASMAGKLAPEGSTLGIPGTKISANVGLPKPILGVGVAGAKELLEQTGLPEPISELASFGVLRQPPKGAAQLQIGKKTKPSGLPERGFEDLKSTRKVSEAKISKLNEKLETDFKTLSDQIIKESPIGETAKELANNPAFKEESRALLDQAQIIADELHTPVKTSDIKKEIIDSISGRKKGFAQSEYEKSYAKYIHELASEVEGAEASAGQLVEQYRKNNRTLDEFYEPGSSKAVNRAKRDATLDANRAITRVMEKNYPDSVLVPVFKEGNARWSKIMDAEMVDKFVSEIFKDGVDFQKMNKFLESKGYAQSFKRALGEDGYKAFRSVVNDMAFSKTAYNKMKVMKGKSGLEVTAETMLPYFINPKLGAVATGKKLAQGAYRSLINYMLDKPKFTIRWKKAIDTLKEGKMSQAAKQFEALHGELLEAEAAPLKGKVGETIEVKPEVKRSEAKGITHQPKEIGAKTKEIEAKTPAVKEGAREKVVDHNEKTNTFRDKDRGPQSHIKEINNEKGDFAGEILYDLEKDNKLYISHIQVTKDSQRKGYASKLLKELLEEHNGREIEISPLKPEGAKFFEKIFGRKFPVSLTQETDRIAGKPLKSVKLTRKDLENARKNLGIKPEAKVEKAKPVRQKVAPKKGVKKEFKPNLQPSTLKMQKMYILDKVEEAIKSPTMADKVEIHVPQDGKFKINNNPEALKKFETKVKRNWPTDNKSEAPFPKHESLSNKLPDPEIKDYEIKTRSGDIAKGHGEVYNDLYAIRKVGKTYKIDHIPSGTNIAHLDTHTKAKKFLAQMYAKKYGKEPFYRAENFEDFEKLLDMKELEKMHRSLNKS